MSLLLGEHWPAWHPTARRGVLETAQGDVAVLALVAPFRPSGVSQARQDAASALQLRAQGVLPLLRIEPANGRIAWVYEGVDGLSARHFAAGIDLGPRASAQLVLEVSRVVVEHTHPGPEPDDVLLTMHGVRVAGFARPFEADPAFTAPHLVETHDGAARVYRIGALFAAVLGAPVSPSSDPDSHEAMVRRALIRAMSQPGAVFGDRYGACLRSMLAWEPTERMALEEVVPTLRALVEETAGPGLEELIVTRLQQWIGSTYGSAKDETTLPQDWNALQEVIDPQHTAEQPGHRTLGEETILGDLSAEDDPTVDSEADGIRTPPSVIERGTIPVGVGPPPEVAAKRPRLPDGFLEDATVPFPQQKEEEPRGPGIPGWAIAAAVFFVIGVVCAALWLGQ